MSDVFSLLVVSLDFFSVILRSGMLPYHLLPSPQDPLFPSGLPTHLALLLQIWLQLTTVCIYKLTYFLTKLIDHLRDTR